tara:strand:+ start:17884 stop:18606 length:723 start_codon:yes stop_codon:yes gene_type:complete
MINKTLDYLESISFGCLALIDPDKKNDEILLELVKSIDKSNFSAILVGGSSIDDNSFNFRLQIIKKHTSKPIILFPGNSNQISKYADGILFTSLLSGRNPKYLIDEQVKGVKLINEYNLDVISTGYILLSTTKPTAVETVSKTKPLDSSDFEHILYHCLAAEYFGMKYVYLENGSGALNPIDSNLVSFLSDKLNVPIIVGGGVKTKQTINEYKEAGAKFVVLGSILEKEPNSLFISAITN